MPNKSKK